MSPFFKGTIDMDFEKREWKLLVRNLIDQFDMRETGELHFVFGPDCAFKDLKTDPSPSHFWYANLSLHPRENAKLIPIK